MSNTAKLARNKLYLNALALWGVESQIRMVFEEMAELQKELCKNRRGQSNTKEIVGEIADVRIMLEQMEVLFSCEALVEAEMVRKISRLRNTIEEESK